MYKRILVPTDGSEPSINAFTTALELSEAFGCEILLLNVINTSALNVYGYVVSNEELKKFADDAMDKTLSNREIKVPVEKKIVIGHPAYVIIEEIENEDIDLVIMGSRGLGAFTGSILGSVSQRVLQNTTCSVMVVK